MNKFIQISLLAAVFFLSAGVRASVITLKNTSKRIFPYSITVYLQGWGGQHSFQFQEREKEFTYGLNFTGVKEITLGGGARFKLNNGTVTHKLETGENDLYSEYALIFSDGEKGQYEISFSKNGNIIKRGTVLPPY